ncbi:hypothetical protein ID866_10804 [Astraeus odoratus]|nr:hypothetical protein ID866_10804 [Astraeus odoratus]
MSTSNKNIESVNWQEVPNAELGWDKADPEDVSLAKLQEKYQRKWVWEAEEVKKCWKERRLKKGHAKLRRPRKGHARLRHNVRRQQQGQEAAVHQVQGWAQWFSRHQVHLTTSPWGGKKKKRTRRAQLIFDDDNDNDNDIVVMSTCKAGKSESRVWEMMAQVVDRRMGEVVEELQGLRKGVAAMAKSNQDLTQVLYCGFQSMDTLVDKVQIFGAKGFLPKPVLESEPTKDELQETLREVEELQEEHLEWAMECLQMRKEWMWQEEAALTKHLKGKDKEPAKESEQEEEEQGTGGEEKEGEAE